MDLLDPLEIDHRHHADFQIGMLGHVHFFGDDGAVQALVEQQVGIGGDVLPFREAARQGSVALGFLIVVDVVAQAAATVGAVLGEDFLQFPEQVGLGSEMAEVVIAAGLRRRHGLLHALAVVGVEGVALEGGVAHALAAEDLFEGVFDRRGAGSRGAGDGNDAMFARHLGTVQLRNRLRSPNSGDRSSKICGVAWKRARRSTLSPAPKIRGTR